MSPIKKHKIIITLDWASINKDVQDKAYRMARLAKLGVENPAAADKFESEISLTEEDMSLLRRAMTQAFAEIITMANQYVWSTSHISDNYLIQDDNLTIILMMPLNFNLAGTESLGQMIHAYIVAKAMLEWFRYTVPSRAQEQQLLADNAKAEILKILSARVRLLTKARTIELIVGPQKPDTTMLYAFDNELFEEVPTDSTHTISKTNKRKVDFTATPEDPKAVAVALPLGYTPDIGGQEIKELGKIVFNDLVYVWHTATSRFESNASITY